jgi:long-chain acyl-CoA synthetase
MSLENPVSIADWIFRQSIERPQQAAWGVVCNSRVNWHSWREAQRWVDRAVRVLSSYLVQPGDRIVTILPNSASWFAVDAACAWTNSIHVPVDPRVTSAMLDHILESVEPRLVIESVDDERICRLLLNRPNLNTVRVQPEPFDAPAHPIPVSERTSDSTNHAGAAIDFFKQQDAGDTFTLERTVRSDISPDSAANILFTSGTSGPAKGVVLSHRNLMSNAAAKLDAMPQFASDVRLNVLPFSHAYARTCEVSTWAMTGGALVASKSIDQFWRDAPVVCPNLINAVPHVFETLYQRIVATPNPSVSALHQALGDGIRMLACGGAALHENVFNTFARLGFPIYQGYGLTETSPVICSNRVGSARPATVGPAIQGIEIRLDDQQQLLVRGENVMLGYYRDPSSTAEKIRDGWLATGDLAVREPDGHYRILGRRDDMIVLSTGRKVAPQPIETILAADDAFRQVILVGQNQSFVTAIVFRSDANNSEPRQVTASRLLATANELLRDRAPYERPRAILLIDQPLAAFPEILTNKGSVRRNFVESHFRDQLDGLRQSSTHEDSN